VGLRPVCSHWRRENFLLLARKGMELRDLDPPSCSIVTVRTERFASFIGAEDHNGLSHWPRGLRRLA
jgi:hypothetical protein